MKRIKSLDGLRGIAILLVMMYHGYYIWADHYPFGSQFKNNILFRNGNLGVQLFFLISGFVILMSLEKTKSYLIFLRNRWLRLFPAMLIVSLVIYFSSTLLPERPLGIPPLKSLLPGLLFVNPKILQGILQTDFPPLETSFWTIFLEVKFYIIFGALFFFMGEKKAIYGNFLLFLSALLLGLLKMLGLMKLGGALLSFVDTFCQFGWFTAGAYAYIFYKTSQRKYLLLYFLISLISIFSQFEKLSVETFLYLFFLVFLFISIFLNSAFDKFLSAKIFTFVGFISYSLYLIHENLMVALIIKFNRLLLGIPNFALPILAGIVPVILAYFITVYMENPLQKLLKKLMNASTKGDKAIKVN